VEAQKTSSNVSFLISDDGDGFRVDWRQCERYSVVIRRGRANLLVLAGRGTSEQPAYSGPSLDPYGLIPLTSTAHAPLLFAHGTVVNQRDCPAFCCGDSDLELLESRL